MPIHRAFDRRFAALEAAAAPYRARRLDRWSPVPAALDAAIAADLGLAYAAREARGPLVAELSARFHFDARFLEAVLETPRERFVLPEDIAASADDTPLPLDRGGLATVSAPHAYLLTYDLLDLCAGDHLLELGTGSGYGAALARRLVGPAGHVTTVEIDAVLHERAARLLAPLAPLPDAGLAGVTLFHGDGRALARQVLSGELPSAPPPPRKVAVTYAVEELPAWFERLLPEGGVVVAPVGGPEDLQQLTRLAHRGGLLRREAHGLVRYVAERPAG